ncbi:MAG TPA: helix-turn-helix transcriptional regulator, partial [Ktedonobacteraceae bacterium]|nr:helix-turn-helix transcriptional regulator [Ktedonobacteraceae bacterium]
MAQHTKLTPNDRLKRERTLRGWTQGDVAGFISTDGYTVNRWERGRAVPSPYFRQKLCELFGKNAEELGLLDEQRTRSESPMPAIWNIPYRRSPFFVGRENIFSRLRAALKAGNMTALVQGQALCGLGGIGKTQTAVEYAYRCCGNYSAVLWAQADSRLLLLAEFVRLAAVLNLPEQTEQDTYSIVQAVKCWLQQQTGWLLIFDGVEDVEVAHDFLPAVFQGHVILTTRIQSTGMVAQRIEIEQMMPEEGMLFLLRRIKLITTTASLAAAMETDRKAAGELTHLLGGLPLALDQAAAYIEETACGIAGYISRYHTCRTKLLALRGNVSPSDTQDHPESIVTTLSLSFNKIRQTNNAALELLSLCAFLHPEAIPEEIFLDGAAELGPILQPAVADLLSLDGVVSDLRKFSLVHR